jgi:hypothetical protein
MGTDLAENNAAHSIAHFIIWFLFWNAMFWSEGTKGNRDWKKMRKKL